MAQHLGSLTPAYGRDYKSAAAAIADFAAGKDFIFHNHQGSTYANLESFADRDDSCTVQLRWGRLANVTSTTLAVVRRQAAP